MSESGDEYPFTFTGRRSGNCCSRPGGMVRVSPAEARAIASHLEMSEAGFRSRYLTPSGDRLKEGISSCCVFLQDGREAGCSIYPVRPQNCGTWPYWPDLRDSEEALQQALRLCPGLRLKGL